MGRFLYSSTNTEKNRVDKVIPVILVLPSDLGNGSAQKECYVCKQLSWYYLYVNCCLLYLLIVWLVRSSNPFDCGWYALVILCFTLKVDWRISLVYRTYTFVWLTSSKKLCLYAFNAGSVLRHNLHKPTWLTNSRPWSVMMLFGAPWRQ